MSQQSHLPGVGFVARAAFVLSRQPLLGPQALVAQRHIQGHARARGDSRVRWLSQSRSTRIARNLDQFSDLRPRQCWQEWKRLRDASETEARSAPIEAVRWSIGKPLAQADAPFATPQASDSSSSGRGITSQRAEEDCCWLIAQSSWLKAHVMLPTIGNSVEVSHLREREKTVAPAHGSKLMAQSSRLSDTDQILANRVQHCLVP